MEEEFVPDLEQKLPHTPQVWRPCPDVFGQMMCYSIPGSVDPLNLEDATICLSPRYAFGNRFIGLEALGHFPVCDVMRKNGIQDCIECVFGRPHTEM